MNILSYLSRLRRSLSVTLFLCAAPLMPTLITAGFSLPPGFSIPEGGLPMPSEEEMEMFMRMLEELPPDKIDELARIGEAIIQEAEDKGINLFAPPAPEPLPEVSRQPQPQPREEIKSEPTPVKPASIDKKTVRPVLKSVIKRIRSLLQKMAADDEVARRIKPQATDLEDLVSYLMIIKQEKHLSNFSQEEFSGLFKQLQKLDAVLTRYEPDIYIPELKATLTQNTSSRSLEERKISASKKALTAIIDELDDLGHIIDDAIALIKKYEPEALAQREARIKEEEAARAALEAAERKNRPFTLAPGGRRPASSTASNNYDSYDPYGGGYGGYGNNYDPYYGSYGNSYDSYGNGYDQPYGGSSGSGASGGGANAGSTGTRGSSSGSPDDGSGDSSSSTGGSSDSKGKGKDKKERDSWPESVKTAFDKLTVLMDVFKGDHTNNALFDTGKAQLTAGQLADAAAPLDDGLVGYLEKMTKDFKLLKDKLGTFTDAIKKSAPTNTKLQQKYKKALQEHAKDKFNEAYDKFIEVLAKMKDDVAGGRTPDNTKADAHAKAMEFLAAHQAFKEAVEKNFADDAATRGLAPGLARAAGLATT